MRRHVHIHLHSARDAGFSEGDHKRDESGRFTGAGSTAEHKTHEFDHGQEAERHRNSAASHHELASAALKGGDIEGHMKHAALGSAHSDAAAAHGAAHHFHGAASGSEGDRKTYGGKANAQTKMATAASANIEATAAERLKAMRD